MKHPKSIRFFLMDGDPAGRLSVELSNWTGKAYRIPRNLVNNSVKYNSSREYNAQP